VERKDRNDWVAACRELVVDGIKITYESGGNRTAIDYVLLGDATVWL
jgi:hypothetical protein